MARTTKLNRVFNFIELNYTNLTNQIINWLSAAYNKSGILFNPASPYGQILEVIKEFFLQDILYLKNFVKQLDIDQAVSTRMIANIARISGHNPSRAMAAKGTLQFKLKQGVSIDNVSQVVIYDNTLIKNSTNGLYYSLKTSTDRNYYTLTPGCQFFINITQGKYETQTFTGDGTISQSFQVNVSNSATIDNFDFQVTLNGISLTIRDHIYDMLTNEYACYTRTGFNGGLDVYFGNGVNGIIPTIGSIITVTYLLNNGLNGNILNNKVNDFNFIDDIYDDSGNVIQPSQLFDIFINTNIQFASDGESIEHTKAIISHVSRNFVLATPSQFIYHLQKLNIFSKVNAFNTLDSIQVNINSNGSLDNIYINEMFLYLIPRITDYFSTNVNYFNVPFSAFYLDQVGKDRIISYLKMQGIISITSVINIIDPQIKRFIINIYATRYDDTTEDNIRQQITNILSNYFANYTRYDRIVKADLITQLKTIDGIDSVNIEFVGKDNEDYHKDGALLTSTVSPVIQSTYATNSNSVNISSTSYRNSIASQQTLNSNANSTSNATSNSTSNSITPSNTLSSSSNQTVSNSSIYSSSLQNNSSLSVGSSTVVAYNTTTQYDPTKLVGMDAVLGDIIIGQNELVILRGGWSNRNGIFFSEDPKTSTGFSTINIIWKGVTSRMS